MIQRESVTFGCHVAPVYTRPRCLNHQLVQGASLLSFLQFIRVRDFVPRHTLSPEGDPLRQGSKQEAEVLRAYCAVPRHLALILFEEKRALIQNGFQMDLKQTCALVLCSVHFLYRLVERVKIEV